MANPTKNQHFISQGEQRLNTSTPQLPERERKIRKFEVVHREGFLVSKGANVKISRNLAGEARFTFERLDGGLGTIWKTNLSYSGTD